MATITQLSTLTLSPGAYQHEPHFGPVRRAKYIAAQIRDVTALSNDILSLIVSYFPLLKFSTGSHFGQDLMTKVAKTVYRGEPTLACFWRINMRSSVSTVQYGPVTHTNEIGTQNIESAVVCFFIASSDSIYLSDHRTLRIFDSTTFSTVNTFEWPNITMLDYDHVDNDLLVVRDGTLTRHLPNGTQIGVSYPKFRSALFVRFTPSHLFAVSENRAIAWNLSTDAIQDLITPCKRLSNPQVDPNKTTLFVTENETLHHIDLATCQTRQTKLPRVTRLMAVYENELLCWNSTDRVFSIHRAQDGLSIATISAMSAKCSEEKVVSGLGEKFFQRIQTVAMATLAPNRLIGQGCLSNLAGTYDYLFYLELNETPIEVA